MNPKALIRSTTIVIAMIAVFTILSELFSPVKNFFALFGHHWIGKSVLALVLLGVLYLAFSKSDEILDENSVKWLIGSVVLSGLAIAGFYIWHFI
jgi:hypothetical protein